MLSPYAEPYYPPMDQLSQKVHIQESMKNIAGNKKSKKKVEITNTEDNIKEQEVNYDNEQRTNESNK